MMAVNEPVVSGSIETVVAVAATKMPSNPPSPKSNPSPPAEMTSLSSSPIHRATNEASSYSKRVRDSIGHRTSLPHNPITSFSWRRSIINKLHSRKLKEERPFEDIIAFCGKLYERIDSLNIEKESLIAEKQRLESENRSMLMMAPGTGQGSSVEDQKRILRLQEEVTELHRRKGEHVDEVMKLRKSLESREAEIKQLKAKLSDDEISLNEYKSMCKSLQDRILEVEKVNEVIRDEHQALQIAFSSLEEKALKKEKEYTLLLDRWMQYIARDAERFNQENEAHMKFVQRQREEALKKAIDDIEVVDEKELDSLPKGVQFDPMSCISLIPAHELYSLEAHEGEVNAIKWLGSGDGAWANYTATSGLKSGFVTGGGDRKVKLWTLENDKYHLKGQMTGSNAAITCIDLEPDHVLASSNDFASRVWKLDGKLIRTLTGHSNKVMAARFLGAANRVVSGSHDRTLKIWDLNRHACIKTLFAGSSCNDVVVSLSNVQSSVISGHFDKRIRFWDTRSDSSCNEILLDGRITSLHVTSNSQYLITCVRDDSLKQLDLRMNQIVRSFIADGFKVGCDYTRAISSPDNDYIAAGSSDGNVYIWNLSNGRIEKVLKDSSHGGSNVITCSWNPNGKVFVSCDKNKKAIVWGP